MIPVIVVFRTWLSSQESVRFPVLQWSWVGAVEKKCLTLKMQDDNNAFDRSAQRHFFVNHIRLFLLLGLFRNYYAIEII